MSRCFSLWAACGPPTAPLPKGFPPETARASLDGENVTVRIPVITNKLKQAEGGAGMLVPAVKEDVVQLSLKEVQAFDTRGRKIGPEAIRDRLKAETHVLVSPSGPADPYFLEVVKEDTLVLVVPAKKREGIPEAKDR